MFKTKILLFSVAFLCSMYSVTYAAPMSVYDLDFSFDSFEREGAEEMGIHSWDALDWEITALNKVEEIMHTVEEGDNLYRIALAYNIPLESLMSWNNLTNYTIFPGNQLKIFQEDLTEVEAANFEQEIKKNVIAATPTISQPVEVIEESQAPSTDQTSEEMVVTATAYTAYCTGCSGTTAYGIDLRANPNQKVIAVDPRVIPLGTKVWVEGYGEAIAGDTGGAIKGNKIDVFIPSYDGAIAWGVKTVKLKVLY